MPDPKFTFDESLLKDAIERLHVLFSNKLIKDVRGKYFLDENHKVSAENLIEQLIISGALISFIIRDDLRFHRNPQIIEKDIIKSILRLIIDRDELFNCDTECGTFHSLVHLRYYQYYILLDKKYGDDNFDTSSQLIKFLYLNPLKSGLFDSELVPIEDFNLNFLLSTLLAGAIQRFSEEFSNMIKLTDEEASQLILVWRSDK